MELLSAISAGIQNYAWHVLWACAILGVIEFAAPQSRYSWFSRVRGAVFWGVYIAVTVSLMTIFTKLWGSLGIAAWVTFHPANWFASENTFIRAAGYVVPILLAYIFGDFFYYWFHRLQHTSKFLWLFHSVHHSVREMSAWNCNHHVTEEVFRIPFVVVPMSLFLVDPGPAIPIISSVMGMHALFTHSCTKLHFGPFRYILADNRFHRIHHSIEKMHHNKNFGSASSIWDLLFRTAHFPRRDEWPDTGVAGVEEPKTIADFLLRPFIGTRQNAQHQVSDSKEAARQMS